jgi:cytochrome c biogenesis protein CcdA
MVVGAAVSANRLGAFALATGLAGSFAGIGMFLATVGYSLGIDSNHVRLLGAMILVAIGLLLIVPSWQTQFAVAVGPISGWADSRFGRFATTRVRGQFALGLLLGVVWSPCVGPTLGAASVLASRGQSLGQVAFAMAAFGTGAALPLLLLGLLSREALTRWRGHLVGIGRGGKIALGSLLVVLGGLTLTGLDKPIETLLVDLSPAWLAELTTRF